MAIKLYSQEELDESVEETPTDDFGGDDPEFEKPESMTEEELDAAFEELNETTNAYVSLSKVHSSLAAEEFSLADSKNQVLFNEYIKSITKKLDVAPTALIATESIVDAPYLLKHQHLALEGVIGSLWDAIKKMFAKIAEAASAFFKKHFTKIGVSKKRLDNVIAALEKTDKDIKQLDLPKIPGSLKSAFPVKGELSESEVVKSLDTAKRIKDALLVINDGGKKMARIEVLDKDFVAKIKGLRDAAAAKKAEGKEKGLLSGRADRKEGKALDKEASSMQDVISDIGNKNSDISSTDLAEGEDEDDVGLDKAKKELDVYFAAIEKSLDVLVNEPIPGKVKFTEVRVSLEDGIEIETEDNTDEMTACSLGSKSSLLKLCKDTKKIIDEVEKSTEDYMGVNNEIAKSMDSINKLIRDLERAEKDMADAAKYRRVLEKKVKARLSLLKNFFQGYNKLNKTLLTAISTVSDGVVIYSTTSMKHFG